MCARQQLADLEADAVKADAATLDSMRDVAHLQFQRVVDDERAIA